MKYFECNTHGMTQSHVGLKIGVTEVYTDN